MSDHYDLIVVGLGAMGSAALFHATERGLRVLGIDRHHPPHKLGSSHAESRITRLAVGEGPQYLPFVARSHEVWRDLEARTGEELFHQSGGYIVTPPAETDDDRWGGFVHRTAEVARNAGIDYELRTPAELNAHLPNVILAGDEAIGFEATGGIVMCERAVATQLQLAAAAGAATLMNTIVERIEPDGNGAQVHTAAASYRADKVIVTTGAWFPELAPVVDAQAVAVTRQVVFWFEVDDPDTFSVDRFPFFLWPGQSIADYSGVFPMARGARPGLKVLGEQFHERTSAETVDRMVSEAEVDAFYERLVAPRLKGVRRQLVHADVCLYTNTIEDHFLIDLHPECDHILYASPCSGHGFKHSTGLAESMVDFVSTGTSSRELSPFARTSDLHGGGPGWGSQA